ncbi:hypothetical protein DPMN_141307 [Dreissena polymorpha]|uniref:Uncharacterized protein n=1 Tax=Dreissena polymorpha TaxID=45954 RepID=A0A9D4GC41_DREPO|nr:hypothetical protein DPMN_141307 [Dreissena polymorpha]
MHEICLVQDGVLKHSDIGVVWKDYPAELHDWLLKLTEAYDLTFPLDDKPVNLVPCLMPEKQPDVSGHGPYSSTHS